MKEVQRINDDLLNFHRVKMMITADENVICISCESKLAIDAILCFVAIAQLARDAVVKRDHHHIGKPRTDGSSLR